MVCCRKRSKREEKKKEKKIGELVGVRRRFGSG